MATTIKIKNSVTATTTPTSLVQGEVAINVTDKKVWVGNAATTPIQIVGAGTTGNAAGSNTQVQYNSSGSFAGDADFTFNGTTVTMANDASISGLTVGKGGGGVSTNTAVGNAALLSNSTGADNTAIGNFSQFPTTGSSNTSVGSASLRFNTSGAYNSAVGHQALNSNTTADNNTAVGYQAGYSTTTSGNNTFIGLQAGYATTAFDNTFVGYQSGAANTTGTNNAAIGLFSLLSNTTGSENTALGRDALRFNTTASNNTAVGFQAGYSNTAAANTFIGRSAGNAVTTGNENTLVGYFSGGSLTTGTKNTFIGGGQGNGSGGLITTGSSNTVIGSFSGNQNSKDIRTSSNNIVLSDGDGNVPLICISPDNAIWQFNGKAAGNYAGILQFCVDFAVKSEVYHDDVNDRFTIQNDSGGVYLASGGTSWTSNSDERLKNITGEIQNGLSKVCTLRAAEYTWKSDESAKPQVGLIAQDVLKVLPQAVQISIEGSTNRDGTPTMMGVSYTETIPLLVAAIKELNAKVEAQALEIATLKGN